MQTFDSILRDLKQGKYAPVYVLFGEEAYFIDQISDYIEQHALDEMAREFDQLVLYGKDYESDMGSIIAAARRFPMMGERQVVIVKEAQNIKKWEPLGFYMENLMPSTVLVFCYKHGKVDKRLKVFKAVEEKGGVMMEAAPVEEYKINNWIRNYLIEWNKDSGKDVRMDENIVQLLADSLGNDLTKIVNALNTLVNGLPPECKVITPEIVQRNIGINKEYSINELQQSIVQHDVLKANRIVRYYATSKNNQIQKYIPILFRFFSNLLIYEYLQPAEKVDRIAGPILGINPFFVKDYARAAQFYSPQKVMMIIGYLREADTRSKGFQNVSISELELWQELIFKIMH